MKKTPIHQFLKREVISILIKATLSIVGLLVLVDIIDMISNESGEENLYRLLLLDIMESVLIIIISLFFINKYGLINFKIAFHSISARQNLLILFISTIIFLINNYLLIPLGEHLLNFPFLEELVNKYYEKIFSINLTLPQKGITFTSIIIITPIAEELFFRGVWYKTLRKKYNFIFSTSLTFIIFLIFHPLPSVIFAVLSFTFIVSFIYEKFDNITYTIIFHSFYNFLALLYNIFIIQ